MLITGVGLIVDALWASMGIVNLGWVSVIQLNIQAKNFWERKSRANQEESGLKENNSKTSFSN